MVFIGSNLPHVWLNDEIDYQGIPDLNARSIVLYLSKDIFSSNFYKLKESKRFSDLFLRAARGIKINNNVKDCIAKKMEVLKEKKDFHGIIALLEILNIIAMADEIEYITHEYYNSNSLQSKADRLADVYEYIAANYHSDVSLEDISKIANLSPTAFCRLFKQRTNRHFIEYLNEARISNACKFLLETNHNISEIAFQCGHKTLSNFNKIFKKITSSSPKEYRQQVFIHIPVIREIFLAHLFIDNYLKCYRVIPRYAILQFPRNCYNCRSVFVAEFYFVFGCIQ